MSAKTAYDIKELPVDAEGWTYVTDSMLRDDPGLGEFLHRMCNSWWRDEAAMRYVLFPSVGKS